MRVPLFQIDAFTSELFAGNPAAVVLLETSLPDKVMQAVAAENNLSETAFVVPHGERFDLRWFTPTVEVDLCGHATLASAFVLFEQGLVKGEQVRFKTQSGTLSVERDDTWLRMDFPARPAEPGAVIHGLSQALGAVPSELWTARDVLAVFESEEEVAALAPDFPALRALDAYAVCATAPGTEVDFVSRFFAPKQGIDEDPVTGSAHCTLAPFWCERLGSRSLRARQISRRGGELLVEEKGDRVSIAGRAVEYLRGEIEVGARVRA